MGGSEKAPSEPSNPKKKKAGKKPMTKAELKAQRQKEEEDIDAIFAEMGVTDSQPRESKSMQKRKKKAAKAAQAGAEEPVSSKDSNNSFMSANSTSDDAKSPMKPKAESTSDTTATSSPTPTAI